MTTTVPDPDAETHARVRDRYGDIWEDWGDRFLHIARGDGDVSNGWLFWPRSLVEGLGPLTPAA